MTYYTELVPHFDAITSNRFAYDRGIAAFKAIVPPPASVVEMGCATGTMSIHLARERYDVMGIDCTSDLLSLATQKAERELRKPQFQRGDIRSFSLEQQCDVFLLYESVIVLVQSKDNSTDYTLETYLDTIGDMKQSFTKMHDNVKESGKILISVKKERDPTLTHKIGPNLTYHVGLSESVSSELRRIHLYHTVERDGKPIAQSTVRKTLLSFTDLERFAHQTHLHPLGFDPSGLFYILERRK